jgi:K+:H+ antiporter
MHGARTFLQDLALVLSVAAITTVVFRKLRQPVVLGYLLAGLIVGPHIPIPLFADLDRIHALSELGVVLVMFSVGLEFSIRKLVRVVPTAGIVGLVQVSSMMWLGYASGQAFGWTRQESVFAGAIVAISSTMIVAKAFGEQGVGGTLAELVFGVLVVQDVAAVLLLAVLTAVSSGQELPASALLGTAGRLAAFLIGVVALGFLLVPRAIRAVVRLKSPETLLVASVGLCFALALLAQAVGYSVALGAFLAGSLVAESGEADKVEHLVQPVRDVFAAVFFVAVGMIVDPSVVLDHWGAVIALVAVVLVGQVASVTVGSLLAGNGVRTSVQAGMSLAQIGEFSFIIAGVGVASGAVGEFIYPVAVAVCAVTSFTTPWLIRASERAAVAVERRLPHRLQTLVALYGSWLEALRARKSAPRQGIGRLALLLFLDGALVVAIVIGAALGNARLLAFLDAHLGVAQVLGSWLLIAAAAVLALPFVVGIARVAKTLGARLGEQALPRPEGDEDPAAAPRRALVLTLQLGIVILVGIPLLAVTQPFVPWPYGALVLTGGVAFLAVGFWRSAADLQDHVQAGAQVVVDALARQAATDDRVTLEPVHPLLPGLGPLTPVQIAPQSPAVGKSLIELDLRALSGATVIAIVRGGEGMRPTGRETLKAGDVLALAGTHSAIGAAAAMLAVPRAEPG